MKALLIDDERHTIDVLKVVVDWEELGFYTLDCFTNPFEALDAVLKNNYDLIISDIKMPGINGIQLLKKARLLGVKSKFIMLSAYGEFEYAQEAIRQDVISYLLKPIDERSLEVALKKATKQIKEEQRALVPSEIPDIDIISTESDNYKLIQKAITFLVENYNKNLTLTDISDHVYMSKNYFSTLFKKETGISVWGYLKKLKIAKAKNMLQTTLMKNSEISSVIGYENTSHFNKVFKELTGKTPHEYRKSNS